MTLPERPYWNTIPKAILAKVTVSTTKTGPIVRLTIDADLLEVKDMSGITRNLLGKTIVVKLEAIQFPLFDQEE